MDRRSFIGSCTAGACLGAAAPAWPGQVQARAHARVLLVDEVGRPLRAAQLKPKANYVFHYPFEATPVFLLDLARPAPGYTVALKNRDVYAWPGGVGPGRSIVAYSAICAHQLVYPTRDVSFISFRKTRANKGVQDELIHCCAEHSQYDPARGAQVLAGPAPQPLATVLLEHDARADTLTAHGTLGAELFDAFFEKYRMKLSLELGARAQQAVTGQATVRELERFCRNTIQC
jgi:arsenite oxidase small subunit